VSRARVRYANGELDTVYFGDDSIVRVDDEEKLVLVKTHQPGGPVETKVFNLAHISYLSIEEGENEDTG
jgi:hypothetical protein